MLGLAFDKAHHFIKFGHLENKSTLSPKWEDIVVNLDDDQIPLIDRKSVGEEKLTANQQQFRNEGVLILPSFLDDSLIQPYCKVRESLP